MSVSTDPTTEAKGQPDAGVMGRYQHILRHRLLMMGALALAILGSLLLDFTMGPSGLSLSSLWQTLLDPAAADAGTRVIVWDIRLPYALMAVVVGFALGLAGAEMQTILNNPLASPFTLGVSSAAALAPRWRSCSASAFRAFPISGSSPPTPLSLRCSPR